MITLEQAIEIAENVRGELEQSTVDSVKDCGDRWFFTFAQDKGKLGSAPFFVSKDDGHCEICLHTLKNLELIGKAKSIPLPKVEEDDV